jgi:deoxyribodipyrimidine photo-lyase
VHHGQISVRRVWHTLRQAAGGRIGGLSAGQGAWLRQLVWREFAHHLLVHFPHTPTRPLREKFAAFPWRDDEAGLRAWQRGRTGYPLVDAGMRQLWATGWMHNRVRMVVGSLLVKDLLVDWREGAAWFWDTLVDADLANNTLGWRWGAGCGADAAPFFRIFNPVSQARKFDPEGVYVGQWVEELAHRPATELFEPWLSSGGGGQGRLDAGNVWDNSYPDPIVNHSEARDRALDALRRAAGAGG